MKYFKPVFKNEFIKVDIDWSHPIPHERDEIKNYSTDGRAYLYMITGLVKNEKIFYIGKAHDQCPTRRLLQKDHYERKDGMLCDYPYHKLFVRFGVPTFYNCNKTRCRIDEIESLLIYAHWSEYMHNKNKIMNISVGRETYHLRNCGDTGPLKKLVAYGIFSEAD